jgi:hypothetical protein
MDARMDDGYIKYSSERRDGTAPGSAQLDALNHARTSLFDLGLIGVYPDGIGYGNLSVRASSNQFVITASATGGNRTLRHEQYCLVEAFSAELNHVQSQGVLPASSEAMTHGAIYAANQTVHCVVHVHSRQLFDYWLTNNRWATPADIPYGTPGMALAVSRLVMTESKLPVIFAMAGHDEGMVAYGADVATTHALLLTELERSQAP